jgi:rod shape determining protein RodA
MLAKIKRIDWLIVVILLSFMCISYFAISSAIYLDPEYGNTGMHTKTLKFYALGFFVLFMASFFNFRYLLKLWIVGYVIGIGLLVAVLQTEEINGARSWFMLTDGLSFQPAELMKLLLILALAGYITQRKEQSSLQLIRDVLPLGLITSVPFFLVLIQPDLGNAVIYAVILLGIFWMGNLQYKYVLIGLTAIVAFFMLFQTLYMTYHDQIEAFLIEQENQHWMARIDTFLDPENADKDDSYHVTKSTIAIGSGGLTGDGFKEGNSVRNRFIPFAFSDSIFVVIGEEFGFMGSALLLLLYFLMIYRMILIAIQCDHLGGALIITGIVSMFVFQIFENIGMLLGIMPLTGITLPFISYGGTSVLINMLCLGIVQSIRMHPETPSPY